jgi:hypothetical protein
VSDAASFNPEPDFLWNGGGTTARAGVTVSLLRILVGLPGFEPGTSCTPSKRASQAAPQPESPIVTVLQTGQLSCHHP